MITPIEDILDRIAEYDDSDAVAKNLECMAEKERMDGSYTSYSELLIAANNLRNMYQLLRSVRFHLANKVLDNS